MSNVVIKTFKKLDELCNNLSNEDKEDIENGIKIIGEIYNESIKLLDKKYDNIQLIYSNYSEELLNNLYRIYQISQNNKYTNDLSCIYFIKNKYTGLIKIETTENIFKRYNQLESIFKNNFGIDDALTVLGIIIIPPKEKIKLESFYHQKYKKYRTFGEWFKINFEIIERDLFYETKKQKDVLGEYYCTTIDDINYYNEIPLKTIPKRSFLIDKKYFIENELTNIFSHYENTELIAYFIYRNEGIYDHNLHNPLITLFNDIGNYHENEMINFYNWIMDEWMK